MIPVVKYGFSRLLPCAQTSGKLTPYGISLRITLKDQYIRCDPLNVNGWATFHCIPLRAFNGFFNTVYIIISMIRRLQLDAYQFPCKIYYSIPVSCLIECFLVVKRLVLHVFNAWLPTSLTLHWLYTRVG